MSQGQDQQFLEALDKVKRGILSGPIKALEEDAIIDGLRQMTQGELAGLIGGEMNFKTEVSGLTPHQLLKHARTIELINFAFANTSKAKSLLANQIVEIKKLFLDELKSNLLLEIFDSINYKDALRKYIKDEILTLEKIESLRGEIEAIASRVKYEIIAKGTILNDLISEFGRELRLSDIKEMDSLLYSYLAGDCLVDHCSVSYSSPIPNPRGDYFMKEVDASNSDSVKIPKSATIFKEFSTNPSNFKFKISQGARIHSEKHGFIEIEAAVGQRYNGMIKGRSAIAGVDVDFRVLYSVATRTGLANIRK